MNRREFLAGSLAATVLLPTHQISALDLAVVENPILPALQLLPMRSGLEGFDFPVTTGVDHSLQRKVWPENPDMYWDPLGEDYSFLFGFHPNLVDLSSTQQDLEAWIMLLDQYAPREAQKTLESHGWDLVDGDLTVLHYTGTEGDRSTLFNSLNMVGDRIAEGRWDWIALPTEDTIILGADESLVRQSADIAKNHTRTASMNDTFILLRQMLRKDSYLFRLLPKQRLPIESTEVAFITRSWTGDEPIIQSIGMQLDLGTLPEQMISTVEKRLATEISPLTNAPYADSIEILDTISIGSSLRIDFVVLDGDWDIVNALERGDLGMLPLKTPQ